MRRPEWRFKTSMLAERTANEGEESLADMPRSSLRGDSRAAERQANAAQESCFVCCPGYPDGHIEEQRLVEAYGASAALLRRKRFMQSKILGTSPEWD